MLRRLLMPPTVRGPHDPWTNRGQNGGRLENFSDCTFSFALTLLAISVEVPKTIDDLHRILPGFFSFAACFTILCVMWHRHVVFFRRYGLHDTTTVALNTALLGLVLFYIYPLKFLMNSTCDGLRIAVMKAAGFGPAQPGPSPLVGASAVISEALPLYLAGFAAVSLTFALLFRHALRRRDELRLSEYEVASTRDDMMLWAVAGACGTTAAAWCTWAPVPAAPYGSFFLFLIPLTRRVQRRRLRARFPVSG